jgi:uncharacterized membrane protein
MKDYDITNCDTPIRCLPEDTLCNDLATQQAAYCASLGEVIGHETSDDGLAYTGGAVEDALLITLWVGIFFLIPISVISIVTFIQERYGRRTRKD